MAAIFWKTYSHTCSLVAIFFKQTLLKHVPYGQINNKSDSNPTKAWFLIIGDRLLFETMAVQFTVACTSRSASMN